jgi:DNA-nicking Smr family endonuclease
MPKKAPGPAATAEDRDLFLSAVRGARPIKRTPRAEHRSPPPPPVPVQSILDHHQALHESAHGEIPPEQSMEGGDEVSFLRPGLAQGVLRKLRRGHWVVQDEIDLHGLNSGQARQALAGFMHASARKGRRCVRVIHGKGLRSPNREPVLKKKVKAWLAQREEVLAFCQAPANQGGSGALLLLLAARGKPQQD